RLEVGHRGQLSAAVVEGAGRDLALRVTAEDLLLAELRAQLAQPVLDRGVELADRRVAVTLGRGGGRCRLFQAEQPLQRPGPDRAERQLERGVAVREAPRISR